MEKERTWDRGQDVDGKKQRGAGQEISDVYNGLENSGRVGLRETVEEGTSSTLLEVF